MDVRSKERQKKRKTRRILNDLRKRSRCESKSIVELTHEKSLSIKNIPKHVTALNSKRLPLTLFKNIRSKAITRVPLSSTVNITESQRIKNMNHILTNSSKQIQNSFNINNKSSLVKKYNMVVSLKDETLFNKKGISYGSNVDESNKILSPSLFSSSHIEQEDMEDSTSESELNYRHEYAKTYSSSTSSEVESGCCAYEEFMNDLPTYLREHYPALTSISVLDKTIAYLRKIYFTRDQVKNNILCTDKISVEIPEDDKQVIIQNPMEYIHTSAMGDWSVENRKQSTSVSLISSPSLSEKGSNTSNVFLDSPEYQYFPHKLNH